MAIEKADFELLERYIKKGSKKRVAVLGDVHLHYPNSMSEFKRCLSFSEVHTFDINGSPTFNLDLNNPLPEEFYGQYDWVIDSGTLYCCFDIPCVLKNILSLLKVGGRVMHTSNLVGFFGRGYYSLSPALFYEFYMANGAKVLTLANRTRTAESWFEFPPTFSYLKEVDENYFTFAKRGEGKFVQHVPNDSLLCCIAEKNDSVPFQKPIPEHFNFTDGR